MSSPDSSPDLASQPPPRISGTWVWLPFFVALVALAGSLWLTLGMGFKACPLCIYQRTFAMGVVAVFGVGVCVGVGHRGVLNLLALPLATAGFGVAVLQMIAELIGRIECPIGILGIGTAPQQSVVALGLLLVMVGLGATRSRSEGDRRWPLLGWAIVLGLLLAVGAVVSPTCSRCPLLPDESLRSANRCLPAHVSGHELARNQTGIARRHLGLNNRTPDSATC